MPDEFRPTPPRPDPERITLSWCAMAVDAVSTGTAGATNRAIGIGATVFRTGVPTTPGAQAGAIPSKIGARNRLGRVGVINRVKGGSFLVANDPEGAL